MYSRYVGSGETAFLISQLDAIRAEEAREEREAVRHARLQDEAIDAEIEGLGEIAETITTAILLTSGFHTHHRQWRRKRWK